MKTAFLLCVAITALFLSGCANQGNTASTNTDLSRRGLVGPGSVAPVSGGPAGPGPVKQRFEP